jgi:purine nucleoside phosphorylase
VSASIGLIVGSGVAALPLEPIARSPTKTPYGPPSSAILTVLIGGVRVACVVRHGETHAIAPHEVNYRANLWALYQYGVRRCVGVNVVGAIAAGFEPGDLAVPRQLVDYTWGRAATFGAANDRVLHVEFSEPFDARLRAQIVAAIAANAPRVHEGVYGVTQGPRLETAAEVDRLARDGCTMVGMTAMPEAVLARELGIGYAICALAVNRAAGRAPGGAGIHAEIETHLAAGMRRVADVLERLLPELGRDAL